MVQPAQPMPWGFPSNRVLHGTLLRSCAVLAAIACGRHDQHPAAPPAPEVGIVALQPQSVLITTELPGRTVAYESSEVRPQVSGIVRARLFTEGQRVERGQTLYQIDASLYRAAMAQARANLQSASAANAAAQIKARRLKPLAAEHAVSELDYAEARSLAGQARAAVEQARAALTTSAINLRFTEVPAPISGRIGRSLVTTGALVTTGQAGPLATIQRLDPMFVDLQQSIAELLELRRSLSREGTDPASADVRLLLPDGSTYDRVGHLQFAEAMVDPSTASVTLRASFENPEGTLLPGMYVRAIVGQRTAQQAILAPQAGVARDPKGNASALVVGEGDRVEQRKLATDRSIGDRWLVREGLKAGDRLIVEGTDKVRPGQVVRAVAAQTPALAPPQAAAVPAPDAKL
jgi:membrane fusion protein (multidrug efflux system)